MELPPISDLGDDPSDYAVSMLVTIPNISKNIRSISSCWILKCFPTSSLSYQKEPADDRDE